MIRFQGDYTRYKAEGKEGEDCWKVFIRHIDSGKQKSLIRVPPKFGARREAEGRAIEPFKEKQKRLREKRKLKES